MSSELTEVRECMCGREFTVVVKYARPWTVCPDCMLDNDPPLEILQGRKREKGK